MAIEESSLEDEEKVLGIFKVLSNENRLKILKFLDHEKPKPLKEIHEGTKEKTGLSYRTTTYHYLEALVKAGLVSKVKKRSKKLYKQRFDKLLINLE